MLMHALRLRTFVFLAGVASLTFSGWASADPPSRVGRLGYLTGPVSYSPAGENDWVQATVNRPLTTGDRLWAEARARAEIQVGGAMVRMNADTGISVLNLDDRIAQLQLTQGTLNVRVRRLQAGQVFEVDTPNLAFTLRQPGEYRIEVDADGNATTIIVRKGQGEVYGEGAAYVIDSRQPYRFTGTGLREYQYVAAPRLDEFDRWSGARDRAYDTSGSARYVSPDVVGYQDLDANGTWRVDAGYGNVWVPNRVAAGWAPYRDGHWAWVDPWGWTWVDDAPWGFAVSHYGRWANLRGTWGWVPGPVRSQAYYAPALVAFVGGDNFQLTISSGNVGGVAWFPLAPHEAYRPSYATSRGYFENINRSNTVINNTVINNTYNTTNVTTVVYANRQVPGAVIAVPRTAFVQSQPVSRAAVRVSRETIAGAPVAIAPPVVPTEKSVRGAAAQGGKPPGRAFERPVVARSTPPAAHSGFAAQQQQLAAKPGHPLDDAARRELKPAVAAPAPAVKVVVPAQAAPPTVRPPPAAAARPGDTRGKADERKAPAALPAANTAPATPVQPAAPAPEQRGRPEQRGQAVSPPPAPPQGAVPAAAAPARVAPPAAVVQPPEQRGKPEQQQRDKAEQRGQPAAAPAAAAPAKAVTPPPAVQPPEQRGKPEQQQRDKAEQRGQPAAAPAAAAPAKAVTPPPGVQPPEQRGKPEQQQRDKPEQRGQAAAAPAAAAPAKAVTPPPGVQPPEQRGKPEQQQRDKAEQRGQPAAAPPPPPVVQQPAKPAKPEPAPAAKAPEPRPPVAAPKAPPPPQAAPHEQKPTPVAEKPKDKKDDGEEQKQKREEDSRKQ